MSVLSSFGISALRAAEARFLARAENIVNVTTPGHSPIRSELSSMPNGPVMWVNRSYKTQWSHLQQRQRGNVTDAEEFVGLTTTKYDIKAAVTLLRTQDELSGTLLDILA